MRQTICVHFWKALPSCLAVPLFHVAPGFAVLLGVLQTYLCLRWKPQVPAFQAAEGLKLKGRGAFKERERSA